MSGIAIRTEHLTRAFAAGLAVDDLSLEVPTGIAFGFLGPNGSGKTTMIRLLLGLLEPTGGRAEVLGFNPQTHGDQVRARVGALLDYPGLYERLTAADNLDFYGRVWHLSAPARRERARELLTRFGLWERRDERVGGWSRGMQQKLGVARALMHRPSLVFLDEPTSGLDPLAAVALTEDLATLVSQEGITVFLTTHNLREAERLCSRVGVIRRGRLLAVGSTTDLRSSAGTHRVEIVGRGFRAEALLHLRSRPEVTDVKLAGERLLIDLRDDPEVAPLVALLIAGGASIEEVRKDRPSLEDAFLALVEQGA